MAASEKAWAGVDVGKTHHWVCVLDADGRGVLSVQVSNGEADLRPVIATVAELADEVVWAVDIIGAPSALLLALLTQAEREVRYASGRVVATMSTAYAGEGKTDAKDAYVIAETARIRRDLSAVGHSADLVGNLGLLTRAPRGSHRRPGSDDQPAAGRDDQRLSEFGEGVRLLLLHGRAGAADRLCQSRPDTTRR